MNDLPTISVTFPSRYFPERIVSAHISEREDHVIQDIASRRGVPRSTIGLYLMHLDLWGKDNKVGHKLLSSAVRKRVPDDVLVAKMCCAARIMGANIVPANAYLIPLPA